MATQTTCTGESFEEAYIIPPIIDLNNLVSKEPKSTKRKATDEELKNAQVEVAKTWKEVMREVKNLERFQTQTNQNVVVMKGGWTLLIVCSDSSEPSKIVDVPMGDFLVLNEYDNLAKAGAETSLSFDDDMCFGDDGKFYDAAVESVCAEREEEFVQHSDQDRHIEDFVEGDLASEGGDLPSEGGDPPSSPYKYRYSIETLKSLLYSVRSDVTLQPGHFHVDMSGMPGISPYIHICFLEAMMKCNLEIVHDDFVLNKNAKSASKMKKLAEKALASSAEQFTEVRSELLPVNDVRFVYISAKLLKMKMEVEPESLLGYKFIFAIGLHASNVATEVFDKLGEGTVFPKVPSIPMEENYLFCTEEQKEPLRSQVDSTRACVVVPSKNASFFTTADAGHVSDRQTLIYEDFCKDEALLKRYWHKHQQLLGTQGSEQPDDATHPLSQAYWEAGGGPLLSADTVLSMSPLDLTPTVLGANADGPAPSFETVANTIGNAKCNPLAKMRLRTHVTGHEGEVMVVCRLTKSGSTGIPRFAQSNKAFDNVLVMKRTTTSDDDYDWTVVPYDQHEVLFHVLHQAVKNFYQEIQKFDPSSKELLDRYTVFYFTSTLEDNTDLLSHGKMTKEWTKGRDKPIKDEAEKLMHKSCHIWPRCELNWMVCLRKENYELFRDWVGWLTEYNLFHGIPRSFNFAKPKRDVKLDFDPPTTTRTIDVGKNF